MWVGALPHASPCAESWGEPAADAPEVALWESRAGEGRAGGPAAARFVRAQGLRAGMTDREREIPGGGGAGAALPRSPCQRRRLPETWR